MTKVIYNDSDDVRIVGIHGMGGLGKTTMTKVIYNEMCKNFDGQCFLDNIREKSKHNGIVELQKRFISSIQKRGVSSVSDNNHGRSLIQDVVRKRKLLLVLDDIDDYSQVDMLMGKSSWYGAQSCIILTTRDKGVLDEIELNCQSDDSSFIYKSYNPKFMDTSDSLQLFSKHAFKDFPIKEYNILCMEVVSIAAGLPLVLVVLGSTFFVLRDKALWEAKLKQLRKIPNKKVLEKLKFSFDALEDTEKEIFLDIACLFIGDNKRRPTYMWEDCGLYPKLGISVLVSRSLITIDDYDKFQMHDQLRDLSRQIVREEGLQGKQCRLWCSEEASRVFELNLGTICVNALCLESHNSVVARHFYHLPNLRHLCMKNVTNVYGDFKGLLPNLRWLEYSVGWEKFSLRNLKMKNLVVLLLNLSNNGQLTYDCDGWRTLKMANNLKVLDLSYCRRLDVLPYLSNLTKLVELHLFCCYQLIDVQGLQKLESLQVLVISCCSSLRRLPNISSLNDLKVFDACGCVELIQIEGLHQLRSLEHLQLRGCYSLKEGLGDLSNLNKLQVLTGVPGLDFTDFSNFKKIKHLDFYKSSRIEIQNLDGLEALEALEDLQISFCSSVVRLPDLLYLKRLKTLIIRDCEQLIEIPDLSELKSLEKLTISFCRSVKALPDLSPLQKLKTLDVFVCEKLNIQIIKSMDSTQ